MSKAKHHPCLNCERSDMELLTKDVTIELDGLTRLVPRVKGWHCPVCGEIEFVGEGSAQRYAAITGGGPNAFSRYERGKARPVAAVINLFRLLDKHPELLAELRGAD